MSDTIQLGTYVVGEKPIPLSYVFVDSSGIPLDLHEYTATFVWAERDGAPQTAPAVVSNPAAGEVTYVWTGTEMSGPGRYTAEFWAGNGVQRFASWKIIFTVRASIGPVPTL